MSALTKYTKKIERFNSSNIYIYKYFKESSDACHTLHSGWLLQYTKMRMRVAIYWPYIELCLRHKKEVIDSV